MGRADRVDTPKGLELGGGLGVLQVSIRMRQHRQLPRTLSQTRHKRKSVAPRHEGELEFTGLQC